MKTLTKSVLIAAAIFSSAVLSAQAEESASAGDAPVTKECCKAKQDCCNVKKACKAKSDRQKKKCETGKDCAKKQASQDEKAAAPSPKADENNVTFEKAKAIAIGHAKVADDAVRNYECDLERENGRLVYEIEFEAGVFEYEYDIDATDGRILKAHQERD